MSLIVEKYFNVKNLFYDHMKILKIPITQKIYGLTNQKTNSKNYLKEYNKG